jgi:glycosyltransferase involved in cell wall biosynthesis
MTFTICLTIFNSGHQLRRVLDGIHKNTVGSYELNCCLDSCTDDSEKILLDWAYDNSKSINIFYGDQLFETRANNLCLKNANTDYAIIIQDDQQIAECGWNTRILKPFAAFDDVFAVSGRGAHNFRYNEASSFTDQNFEDDNWSDLLQAVDHVCDEFYIRDSVYRGPLAINLADLRQLGYFDESFKQDCDDHDLNLKMKKVLGKKVGYYAMDWNELSGSTRDESGQSKVWVKKLQQKNIRTVWDRHKGVIVNPTVETRVLK